MLMQLQDRSADAPRRGEFYIRPRRGPEPVEAVEAVELGELTKVTEYLVESD